LGFFGENPACRRDQKQKTQKRYHRDTESEEFGVRGTRGERKLNKKERTKLGATRTPETRSEKRKDAPTAKFGGRTASKGSVGLRKAKSGSVKIREKKKRELPGRSEKKRGKATQSNKPK